MNLLFPQYEIIFLAVSLFVVQCLTRKNIYTLMSTTDYSKKKISEKYIREH